MASSSSSSSPSSANMTPQKRYDVFLSFRGDDTRDNFISHLYAALCRKQIATFIDNQLVRGDEISQSLLNAIEESNISLIIFSEGYASSGWCLDELVKVLECKNNYGQIVIPVFYRVDPSDVRNQTGIFGASFSKLEERFKEKLKKLQKWRFALREAANLSGFDSHAIRSEYVLIEKIVEDILERLNDMYSSEINKDLVGIESRMKEIELLLNYGSTDVCTLGIWGIGGIGKTTIAGVIFNKISNHFDGSYFIQNVREEAEKIGGLAHLRRELFSTLLEDKKLNVGNPSFGLNFESKRLRHKKILIVFDDVTHVGQIESLIGSFDWFMPGSLIVITTRNKQVLQNSGVKKIYEMKELGDVDALKLFSRHAFKQNYPDVVYEELSYKIIQYAQGVPLALKVLGCFLFGRSKEDWKSAIKKLKKIPHSEIQKVLKISYDGLDDEEQNIFLDIACFFKGEDRDFAIKFLEASGFSAKIGIRVLIDKCLVFVSNNMIRIHELLQEMGKEIVRQESIDDPGKRSRLWHHNDIYEVLTYNTGTKAIQGISLDMSEIEEISLSPYTFRKMRKLRFLKFIGENKCKLSHFRGPGFEKVRCLHWHGYPLKSLPSNIHPENLVSLELPDSKVEQLWDGVQNLVRLKQIDLSDSKQLTKLPDLSKARNLENLSLKGCSSLVETHSSIQHLNKLTILNLNQCKNLKSLSCTSIHSESLKILYLSGCSNLKKVPEISCSNIEVLFLDGTAIEELPSSIDRLARLVTLNIRDCARLEQLPRSICKLKSLKYFNLSGCSNLQSLPDELGNLDGLKKLEAERIGIKEVPSSIACLNNLDELHFEKFRGHEHMGFLFPVSLSLDGLRSLTSVKLIDCGITELPENLGQLSSLEHLYLEKNNFERIPESIINLPKLQVIILSHCERLLSLPKLPCNLYYMDANHCTSLETLSDLSILFTLGRSCNLFNQSFWLTNCFKLDRNELRKITEDALQKIQLTASKSWKEQDQTYYPALGDHICYPGSEIPGWFQFQSTGSSTIMELPPGWFNNKFVGFALCAVVSFKENDHERQQDFGVWCDFKYKTEVGDWEVASELHVGRICYVDSDHIILGYHLLMYSEDHRICIDEAEEVYDFQFYLTDYKSGERVEVVRKCGIRLLYAQDILESRKDRSRSVSTEVEEERDLHPKRLRECSN